MPTILRLALWMTQKLWMSKPRRLRRAVSGILLLDKPLGLSSNAALQRVKHLYQADKAGHTGSLDPLATGVLPICLGEATKLSGHLLEADKQYCADLRLGVQTSTGDAEGEVINTCAPPGDAALQVAATRLCGEIEQVPPMYSALKHRGQPLYALARQGVEVERKARQVRIDSLRVERLTEDTARLWVRCSKGTYIRTLAEDLARLAGSCASLSALRRTAVMPFEDKPLVTLEWLDQLAREGGQAAVDAQLLAPVEGVRNWPQVRVDVALAAQLAQGRQVSVPLPVDRGRVAVLDEAGQLLGLAEAVGSSELAPRRWLRG